MTEKDAPMQGYVSDLIQKHAERIEPRPGDYYDAEGLLHCGKCGKNRELRLVFMNVPRIVRCMCACESAEAKRKEEEEKRREEEIRISQLRTTGLQDPALKTYTFANDHGDNPLMEKARKYVDHFKEFYDQDIGLLLFGDVGTGKSFFAGCIANALIDQGTPVLMTNFPKILRMFTNMYKEDINAYIQELTRYPLLIIDDLGIERSTEFALEQVYSVIDARYQSRKPMIITTNLRRSDMVNLDPDDIAHARIYDRILEVCQPILFNGKNYRTEIAREKREKALELLK